MSAAPLFDRNILRLKQARAKALEQRRQKNYGFLAAHVMDTLSDRLLDINRTFPLAVQSAPSISLQENAQQKIENLMTFAQGDEADIRADEEYLPFADQSLDLFISPLTLHTINDLPGALIQIRRALKPDGLFLGALFGGETLYQLRECFHLAEQEISGGVSPRIFPFADKQQMGALLQRAGYALPVVDSDIITVTYENLPALCHDLRGMGQSNIIAARRKNFTSRAIFERAEALYRARHADKDGRLEAGFEIIYLAGWAPHERQQVPLRPGSAETSLADHLGTTEQPAGEKVH